MHIWPTSVYEGLVHATLSLLGDRINTLDQPILASWAVTVRSKGMAAAAV